MLPTDPFYRPGQMDDTQAYAPNAQLGWGEAAPFPYAPEQGAGAAMPQPGAPPPAQSLIEAAQMRQGPDMYAPPPASIGMALNSMEDLQRRQRPGRPRPHPLRAAVLIELGKLMQEHGRDVKQHHALLEAYHAMNGPGGPGNAT